MTDGLETWRSEERHWSAWCGETRQVCPSLIAREGTSQIGALLGRDGDIHRLSLDRPARGPQVTASPHPRQVVVLTLDLAMLASYWLIAENATEVVEIDSRCFPLIELLIETLGGTARVESAPIPQERIRGALLGQARSVAR